jgi:hypothetical protein
MRYSFYAPTPCLSPAALNRRTRQEDSSTITWDERPTTRFETRVPNDNAMQPVPWHILIPEDDINVVEAMGFKAVDSSVTAWAEGLRGLHSPIVAK